MKGLIAGAVFGWLAVQSPASAETAEEAVAYVFVGLADGAALERDGTTMKWVEVASSPATFDGKVDIGGRRADIRFIVTAVEDCQYEITLEGPSALVPGGNRLFARVALTEIADVTVEPGGYKAAVDGIGFCETAQTNPSCLTVREADLFGVVDAERHRHSVDFLRNEVCTVVN